MLSGHLGLRWQGLFRIRWGEDLDAHVAYHHGGRCSFGVGELKFVKLVFATVAIGFATTAVACDCLGLRANQWSLCARKTLPKRAEREAIRLWEVRNQGHINKSNRIDRIGERRWIATWRKPLAKNCGPLADALQKDVSNLTPHIPEVGLDEIYVVAFGT
jgi:hypothetical protein